MGPRVLAWMKNTQYVGAVACDGEWLVVVGCYWLLFVVIGFYWLLFLGEIGQSFVPLSPRLPLLDPPSFTYDWVSYLPHPL